MKDLKDIQVSNGDGCMKYRVTHSIPTYITKCDVCKKPFAHNRYQVDVFGVLPSLTPRRWVAIVCSELCANFFILQDMALG